jgi:hypothetical protein
MFIKITLLKRGLLEGNAKINQKTKNYNITKMKMALHTAKGNRFIFKLDKETYKYLSNK